MASEYVWQIGVFQKDSCSPLIWVEGRVTKDKGSAEAMAREWNRVLQRAQVKDREFKAFSDSVTED